MTVISSETYEIGSCKIIKTIGKYSRSAKIHPLGFWSDVVRVYQDTDMDRTFGKPEITWSSGGKDNKLGDLETIDNLIQALNITKEIYVDFANYKDTEE